VSIARALKLIDEEIQSTEKSLFDGRFARFADDTGRKTAGEIVEYRKGLLVAREKVMKAFGSHNNEEDD
jgi:hypothetical protein